MSDGARITVRVFCENNSELTDPLKRIGVARTPTRAWTGLWDFLVSSYCLTKKERIAFIKVAIKTGLEAAALNWDIKGAK